MSNVPPDQPTPFAAVPTHATKPTGNTSPLAVILIVCAVGFVALLACGGLLIALTLPAVNGARTAARNMQYSNQLKQVGLAIHNYHSTYKQLPPTVIVDDKGQETSGWRVCLVPFLAVAPTAGSQAADMPSVVPLEYSADLDYSGNGKVPTDTRVFAIVAANGVFPPTPNTVVRFRSVKDGLSNTLIAVSLPNRVADWKSNVNLTPDQAYQALMELEKTQVAHLLMADGAVLSYRPSDGWLDDRATFDALVSCDGGELISTPDD